MGTSACRIPACRPIIAGSDRSNKLTGRGMRTCCTRRACMLQTTCMHAARAVFLDSIGGNGPKNSMLHTQHNQQEVRLTSAVGFPDKRSTGMRARKNYHQHPELVHVLAVSALRWRVAHNCLHLETQQSTVHTRIPRAMSMPVARPARTQQQTHFFCTCTHAREESSCNGRAGFGCRVWGLGFRVQGQTNSFSWRCKEAMPPEPSATLSSTRAACMRSLSCTVPAPSGLHG